MLSQNDLIKEDNEIIKYDLLEKIANSGIEKCVCKIKQEININGQLMCKTGTGFFCHFQSKNMKAFITNNHVINEDFIKKEKKLIIFIEEEKKEINLEKSRYKYTNEELDFTIIEILEEDNILNI